MRKDEFINWMQTYGGMRGQPVGDAVSRCKRIEDSLRLDLDAEYQKDGGRSVIDTLTYTSADEAHGRPAPDGLELAPGANVRNALASLKSAVKKYFEFCTER